MENATIRLRLPLDLINLINKTAKPDTMASYIRKCIEHYLKNVERIKYDYPRGDYNGRKSTN